MQTRGLGKKRLALTARSKLILAALRLHGDVASARVSSSEATRQARWTLKPSFCQGKPPKLPDWELNCIRSAYPCSRPPAPTARRTASASR